MPDTVVQRSPNGLYAYVATADNIAEYRPLTVGLIADNQAVIEDGLKPGERVIVAGHYRVQNGTRLNIIEGANTTPGQSQQVLQSE